MKIVIPGGSGQVGTVLARAMQSEGHDVLDGARDLSRQWTVARQRASNAARRSEC